MRGHAAQQVDRAADVDVEVLERDLHRLADRLLGGEVDHRADLVRTEHLVERAGVPEVDLVHGDVAAAQLAHGRDGGGRAVREIVGHHDIVTVAEQLDAGVAADEPGSAGYQDGQDLVTLPQG